MIKTEQIDFWQSDFGKNYTDRTSRNHEEWNKTYLDMWGKTKIQMNEEFIGHLPKDIKILEVGCNTGMQLNGLQIMGFQNLYGIELQPYAAEEAKKYTKNVNIVCGSGFDLPFKDNYFDIVCTNGVLIHISPNDISLMIAEMVRCSKKYIWGFEYFSENTTEINYRGHDNRLWKSDFATLFIKQFPDLKLVKKEMYPYIDNPNNVDCMYLLEKK